MAFSDQEWEEFERWAGGKPGVVGLKREPEVCRVWAHGVDEETKYAIERRCAAKGVHAEFVPAGGLPRAYGEGPNPR